MKKSFTSLILAATVILSMGSYTQVSAEQRYFKPESGGYRLVIPAAAEEIYHTTTGIRFVVGKKQLVSADIYSMPNFISVPMGQYSDDQKKDLGAFIQKTLDFSDLKYLPQTISAVNPVNSAAQNKKGSSKSGSLKERLQAIRDAQDAKDKVVEAAKTDQAAAKAATSDLRITGGDVSFALEAPKDSNLNRKYLTGKAYQLLNDKLLVVTVASPEAEQKIAQAGLEAVTADLKLNKPKYPDDNILTSNFLGMALELPAGWHAYTLKADNIIFARSLSSVHDDNAMIRAFKTNEFDELAKADTNSLNDAENNFVDKITKYTPNISIVKHEPVVIDGLNGSIVQFTDSDDLKKVFVVNTYLFTKDGIGYQIRFNTDDTINYDLKMQAYTSAVKSFRRLVTSPNGKVVNKSVQSNKLQEIKKAWQEANQLQLKPKTNQTVKPASAKK